MATPVFCCGFECGIGGSAGSGASHWTSTFTSPATIDTTIKRSGDRAMRCNVTASATGNSISSFTAGTRYVIRIYVYFASLPSADTALVYLAGNASTSPQVRFKQSESKIYAAVGTTFGAAGVTVTTGVWYRIDCDLNINTGGNDTADVRVEGVACGQATATGQSASTTTVNIGIGNTCTADLYYDDILISQTGADYPLGAGYVNHFVPTADGTHNIAGTGDFQRTLTGTDILNATTTAFQLVDEIPLEATVTDWINMLAPPNATDYVECIFGPAPGIQIPVIGPRAVDVICGINQAATGTGNMEIRLNDNGTTNVIYTATAVAGVAVATGQVFKRKHYATAPTGGAWNANSSGAAAFNNLRIRFGSPAAVDVNPDQYFGCAMVEAEFPDQLDASMYARPFGVSGQMQMNQLLAT